MKRSCSRSGAAPTAGSNSLCLAAGVGNGAPTPFRRPSDGNGPRSFETLLRYRGAAMAEFWRALRTLKALQAEEALRAEQTLEFQQEVGPMPPWRRPRSDPRRSRRWSIIRYRTNPSATLWPDRNSPARAIWSHPARAPRTLAAERTRDQPRAAYAGGACVPDEAPAAFQLKPTLGKRKPPEPYLPKSERTRGQPQSTAGHEAPGRRVSYLSRKSASASSWMTRLALLWRISRRESQIGASAG